MREAIYKEINIYGFDEDDNETTNDTIGCFYSFFLLYFFFNFVNLFEYIIVNFIVMKF